MKVGDFDPRAGTVLIGRSKSGKPRHVALTDEGRTFFEQLAGGKAGTARLNEIAIRVEAVAEHGMATIWDADVLTWAASQIVEARDAGLRTSRLMVTTPREILTFTRRGTGARDYHRLKAALDQLQSTTVATSLPQTTERRMHRFSWINEWSERADAHGNADGIDLIMPDWFWRSRFLGPCARAINRPHAEH